MKPLAATALVLVITAALWFASRPGEDPEPEVGEAVTPDVTAVEDGAQESTPAMTTEDLAAPTDDDETLQSVQVTPDVRVAVSEEEEVPRIRGVVVDAKGAPIAGVTVVAEWERTAVEPSRREVMKSAEDGTFSGDARSELMPWMSAEVDGVTFEPFRAESLDGIRVVGGRHVRAEIDVRLPNGQQPDEATLKVTHERGGTQYVFIETWTPSLTTVTAEAPIASVVAHVEPKGMRDAQRVGNGIVARYSSEVVELDSSTLDGDAVRVDVRRGSILTVEISDPNRGEGVDAPWVRIVRSEDIDRPGWGWAMAPAYRPVQLGSYPARTHVWADGALYVSDLEPGEWVVGVGRTARRPVFEQRVTIGSGDELVSAVLPDESADPFIRVRCLGPDGEPLEGVRFFVEMKGERFARSGGFVASKLRPDGLHWIKLSSLDDGRGWEKDRAAYSVSLTARSLEYGATVVDVEPSIDDYEVRFAKPGTLIVETSGDAGGGLFARAREVGARGGLRQVSVSSATSTANLLLQPGEYEVELLRRQTEDEQASRTRPGAPSIVVAATRVRVGTETQRVAMAVPELFELEVEVEFAAGRPEGAPAARRTVVVMRDGEEQFPLESLSARVSGSNRVTFGGLPAGEYRVAVFGSEESVAVTVPSEGVVLVPGGG